MIKCPNKNLPEWKELQRVVPEAAYTIWDLNNGYGIDKAPNGESSILFEDLLKYYQGDRDKAIKAKATVYSNSFKNWFEDQAALNELSNSFKEGNIIFGHPGIGKTYSVEKGKYADKFIDWDVEYNTKRDAWIEQHSNTKKGTPEYKQARNEYLIYPEKYPEYIAFLTKEWNRVKEKAKNENKVLLASPHTLLKLFPKDFNLILNLKEDDFINRNINRGGKQLESSLWKEGIDSTIASVENIPTMFLQEGEYLEDLLNKINVSKAVDKNGEPLMSEVIVNDTVNYNPEDYTPISQEALDTIADITKLYDRIQKGLKDRLNSIKRYSTKNTKVWNQMQTLISQLSQADTEQGILQFIEHIRDTIDQSIDFLNKPIDQINAKQIYQLSKDYVGFYKPLLDSIQYVLDTTDLFKSLPEYNSIKETILEVASNVNKVNNSFINVAKKKAYGELRSYLKQQGMPTSMIQDTINWLDDPKTDSSMVMNWFGMQTNSNNAVQQTIAKMLNDVKNATSRQTLEVGLETVKLANAAKQKYGNDVQKLIYEKLSDGTYSGYRVKPENWGQMKKDQKDFLEKLAAKLGIPKNENNQFELPADEDIQKKWFNELNKWYGDRAERKYKAEYYTLRNKMLSLQTRDAQSEIQRSIDSIVESITIGKVQFDNLLIEAEFKQLEDLRKQKQLLANPYNLDGSSKTGTDLKIAQELTAFNEEVSKHIKYEVDREAYETDRKIVAEKYGENSPQLKLWEKRNTAERYTQAFYDRIRDLERQEANSDPDGLYQQLVNKRKKLLQLYKSRTDNKIDVDTLTDDERASLKQLDQDIADAYTWVKPEEQTEQSEGKDKFSNFAEIALTDKYYEDAERARNSGPESYNHWFDLNHYEDGAGRMHAASYYTELRPREEFKQQYTEVIPIGRYSKLDPTSDWYNDKWKSNGPTIQPNLKYYDNSKAYNEMASKPEVKALYDKIEQILDEANSWISFIQYAGDNRMPQIPARFMQALSRKDGIMDKLKYAVEDIYTTKQDDLDFVEEFSTMPNGDPIKVIPTRFVKMLDDPNIISTDATAAAIQYYNMAANYKNMSEKQAEVELMLSLLKNVSIRTKKELKTPGSSNLYKQSQLLVDRLMYGRNKTPLIYTTDSGKEINVGKVLDTVRGFVTKVNLSGNLWSIGTSFFTDATYTTLEAKMGRFFELEDLNFAKSEFARQLPEMMAGIGNPNPKGKLPYLLMLNQVVKDNKELFDRLDQSSVLRSINQNFWFAGYTQADYTVKSHTLLSIYHNYRFVENEGFLSKMEYINKYYPDDRKKGAVAFKQLKTTLYDAYKQLPNGDTVVDDKYSKYITEKLLNDVKNRIDILARRTDGTIREVDKAGIHANSIASYLVLHRNFMVSALHDRFKKKQFNLDLGVMEEGYYRSTGRFLSKFRFQRGAIASLIADYKNMEEYEQYAVRRTLNELCLIAGSTLVALTMASLVDGDDDYNNWFTQSLTYLAMRSAFEFRTMYNPFEFLALIKSPTAAFNWFDNASSFINLINPAAYLGDKTPFTIIDRGVYKGMPYIFKNVVKVTPFKSIIEAKDPKAKRNYLQNQLMNF